MAVKRPKNTHRDKVKKPKKGRGKGRSGVVSKVKPMTIVRGS